MYKKSLISCAVLGVALIAAGVLVVRANANPAQSEETRVGALTPWKAMEIAEKKTGGHAVQAVYEFDDGHWGYAVYVVRDHKLMEIEMDKMSGKVGDSESANPAGEARELESDLKAAMKKY